MKRIIIVLLGVSFLIIAASCGSVNNGISASKNKNGSTDVNGLIKNIAGYDANLNVFGTDKLYTNGLPPNAKFVVIKPVRGVYNIKDPAIKYVFQLRDTLFNKKSYIWVLEVTNDSRIGTPIVMDSEAPKSNASSNLGMKTFDIYGSTIKAVNVDDGKTVMVKPYRLSFMLSADQAETLVLYSYNGQDMIIVPLTQESQVGSNFKVKAVTIDLSFGNRFTFMTANGRFPNVSPQLVAEGHPKLDGVALVKNDLGNEPFYLFEVIGVSEQVPANFKSGSCSVNGDCDGYYGLELPPARQAQDANYPDGYIRLDVCDVYKSDKSLFLRLLSGGAIGFDRSSGANQSTVRIRWQDLESLSPRLWAKYKNKIIYP